MLQSKPLPIGPREESQAVYLNDLHEFLREIELKVKYCLLTEQLWNNSSGTSVSEKVVSEVSGSLLVLDNFTFAA